MKYTTASGNKYYFENGRVTCNRYGVVNEPAWQVGWQVGCLKFRIKSGWFLTTPVISTESF